MIQVADDTGRVHTMTVEQAKALMDGKTALPMPSWLYLLIVCPLIAVFFLLARKQKLIPVLLESIVLMGVHLFAGRMLALNGRTVPQLYFIAVILLLMVYFVIEKYFGEKLRRKKRWYFRWSSVKKVIRILLMIIREEVGDLSNRIL